MGRIALGLAMLAWLPVSAVADAPQAVTIDNFVRAESDMYLAAFVQESGGLGRLHHRRDVASIDNQTVIRLNRDTLYSSAVFDLDAGPVTVTLPDMGGRFMSMMVVTQDHYVPAVFYTPGPHEITREMAGTRYAAVAIRTLVNPGDPADLEAARALQDGIRAEQASPGRFEIPRWDPASQKKVRDALLVLASTTDGFRAAFGRQGEVDPVRHLLGTAAGWGGNPDRDAVYMGESPAKNDGITVHRVTVGEVPVDAFWSISVYNAQGYYEKNDLDAYTVNSITGKKGPDGSTTVQFGGCDGKIPNCIPIMKGWNYTVRLYRPRTEILEGRWKFPVARPVD
jgi:hypothetical protein